MAIWIRYVLIAIGGYFLGNISVGILIGRLWGVRDIREHGSGNAGSTNVLRTVGWLPSVMTLLGDCAKAYLAATLGRVFAGEIGMLIGGMSAVVGHDFPALFRFRGGKGIASSLGLVLAIDPLAGIALLGVEVAVIAATAYVSAASLLCCLLAPVSVALFTQGEKYRTAYIVAAAVAGALSIFCHRKNIGRLLRHKENKLDFQKISGLSKRKHK